MVVERIYAGCTHVKKTYIWSNLGLRKSSPNGENFILTKTCNICDVFA